MYLLFKMKFHQSNSFVLLSKIYIYVCLVFFLLGSLKHHKGHIAQDFREQSFIFVDTSKRTMVSRPSAQAA